MKLTIRDLAWGVTSICLFLGGMSIGLDYGFNHGYVKAFTTFCPEYPGNMIPVIEGKVKEWIKDEDNKKHVYDYYYRRGSAKP
jgi:hypothetical protein